MVYVSSSAADAANGPRPIFENIKRIHHNGWPQIGRRKERDGWNGKRGRNEAAQNKGLVGRSFQPFLYVTMQNGIDTYLRVSFQQCI